MTADVSPADWGVSSGYHDFAGRWHDSPVGSVGAVLDAMGAHPGGPPPPPAVTVRLDHQLPPLGPGRVHLEHGGYLDIAGELPPDTPTGYHRFEPRGGEPRLLVVSPGRVRRPTRPAWGVAAQLYAARSTRSWGIGDLDDLARIGRWSASLGAEFVLVNPLHAATPAAPGGRIEPSPYYPGSRCFSNPLYIAVDKLPGANDVAAARAAATAGQALNAERRIDRQRVWQLKEPVLWEVFERRAGADLEAYRDHRGESLELFARYCACAETLGPDWRRWPPGAAGHADPARVRFHAWLQMVLDAQLASAARQTGLVADLAVGVDPNGPDAWIWSDCFAEGMRVGAPPDEFNTKGQNWGLPPFDPWRLRAASYEPWIAALRAGLAHGKGLRVDHVMGLFRLFWIPEGTEAGDGVYVSYPHHDLLNILALEAERAGAYVVGEDLGTVQDEVRADLAARQVLSYRLWWFEDTPPSGWPAQAMAAVTTHDLPTVAGMLTGSDIQAQRDIGAAPNEESSAKLAAKLSERAPGTEAETVIEEVYADLAGAPCDLLVATLDDMLAVQERPNMPGTTDLWPNWSLALPVPLEEWAKGPLPGRIAYHLNRPGRAEGHG